MKGKYSKRGKKEITAEMQKKNQLQRGESRCPRGSE